MASLGSGNISRALPYCLAVTYGFCLLMMVAYTYRYQSASSSSQDNNFARNLETWHHHAIIEPDTTMVTNNTVMVFIQSAALHIQKRARIRATWANRTYYNQTDGRQLNFTVIFAIGSEYIGKPAGWSDIREEITTHEDILLLSMRDEYEMLVLKGWYTLKWIIHKLPQVQYVIKTDDDMLLNIDAWLDIAESLLKHSATCCIVGKVYKRAPVVRNLGKYSVTEYYYPQRFYPSYCSGMGYLMTRTAVKALVEVSSHMRLFVQDDAFFTGFAAYVSGIRLVSIPHYSLTKVDNSRELRRWKPQLGIHADVEDIRFHYWHKMTTIHRNGGKRVQLQLTSIPDKDRILPDIKVQVQLNYTSAYKDECSRSNPIPGTNIMVEV